MMAACAALVTAKETSVSSTSGLEPVVEVLVLPPVQAPIVTLKVAAKINNDIKLLTEFSRSLPKSC
jgi:hypothetical protein